MMVYTINQETRMEMSPGEIFDRWTILRMKAAVSEGLAEELQRYESSAISIMWSKPADAPADEAHVPKVIHQVLILMESNAKIWMLEASLRKEFKEDSPVFGQRIEFTFIDGELMLGRAMGYRPEERGFFFKPADPKSNNEVIFVPVSALTQVQVGGLDSGSLTD